MWGGGGGGPEAFVLGMGTMGGFVEGGFVSVLDRVC